jgi:hypothetical protein
MFVKHSRLKSVASERDCLLEKAREKTIQAYKIDPELNAYNLSCVCAVIGDVDGAFKFLAESKAGGHLPSKSHIEADEDLEQLRGHPDFDRFLAELT